MILSDLRRFDGAHDGLIEISRRQYLRSSRGCANDLMDAEWGLLEPLMPRASPIGRPRETDLRMVLDAILCIASTGCQRRQLPRDFPPYSIVQSSFYDNLPAAAPAPETRGSSTATMVAVESGGFPGS